MCLTCHIRWFLLHDLYRTLWSFSSVQETKIWLSQNALCQHNLNFSKSLSLYIPIKGTQLLKENSLSCITMTIKRNVLYETMPDVRQGIQNIKKMCQQFLKRSLCVVWNRTLPALSAYFVTLLSGDRSSQSNWQSKMNPSVTRIYQYACKRFPIFQSSVGQGRPECDSMTYHDQPCVLTSQWNRIFIFLLSRKLIILWRQHMIQNLARLTYGESWFAVTRSHHHHHHHHPCVYGLGPRTCFFKARGVFGLPIFV
jgi:hypothetical protein